MDAQKLLRAPQKLIGRPCLLASAESVLLEECRDGLRAAARAAGFDQHQRIDASARNFDWNGLALDAISPGLFASRRLLDLRLGSAKLPKDAQLIVDDILARADPDLQLLISVPDWSRQVESEAWINRFASHGHVVGMWPLRGPEVGAWLTQRAHGLGVRLDEEARELLLWRTEGNLLAALQEVRKLALARPATDAPNDAPWTAAELDGFIADSARFDVFRLVDEALAGRPLQVRRVLHGLRSEGVHPASLLGWVCSQVELAARLAAELPRGRAAAQGWLRTQRVFGPRVERLLQAAARHGAEDWMRLWHGLREVDLATKGRHALPGWLALERLLLRVALPAAAGRRFAA